MGMDPRIGQPGCRGLCREPFFSGAVTLSNAVSVLQKVATYGDHPQKAYVRHMWTGVRSVRVVLVRLSHAWCTSIRIAATLGYE
jgi:hypothetical protein